jgi:hypothetical protein
MKRFRADGFRGVLADAIAYVSAMPEGRDLALVLKTIQSEFDGLNVRVSGDLHRVTVNLQNGKLASVRVTTARKVHAGSAPILRFKPPRDPHEYDVLYFGGVDSGGRAVVHKLRPAEIGNLKTLTLRCGTA